MPKRKMGSVALLRRKSVLAVNLAAVSLIAWGFVGESMRSRDMQAEIDRLEEQAAALEMKNLESEETADRFAASPAIEREARLKLNMQRPGEEVVVIRGSDGVMREVGPLDAARGREAGPLDAARSGEGTGNGSEAISNVKKWLSLFFPMTNEK